MNHLENERAARAHLDLTDVKPEAEERFQERTLAVGLSAEGDDLRNRKLLAEGHGGRLKAIVRLKSRLQIGRSRKGGISRV